MSKPITKKQGNKIKYTSITEHTSIDEVRKDKLSYVNKTTLRKKSNTLLL